MGVKPLTEKGFMQTVIQYAKLNKWLCYHTYDSRKSEPGFPDLVLVRDGQIIFAELKLDNGKTTQAQDKWILELQKCYDLNKNVFVEVWRPSNWETVKETLRYQ